jgi:hypothetical protein
MTPRCAERRGVQRRVAGVELRRARRQELLVGPVQRRRRQRRCGVQGRCGGVVARREQLAQLEE